MGWKNETYTNIQIMILYKILEKIPKHRREGENSLADRRHDTELQSIKKLAG
jgi:hypothetical protein